MLHKLWKRNSFIINKWILNDNVTEIEYLINLDNNGQQHSIKIQEKEDLFNVISDTLITEDEEVIDLLA